LGVARALDLLVCAAGPLMGLRESRARLSPVRRARALACGPDARGGARADGAARRGRRLVAPRQGAAVRLRLRLAGGGTVARADRPLEPARARARFRLSARAVAPPPGGGAPRVRGDRRRPAGLL